MIRRKISGDDGEIFSEADCQQHVSASDMYYKMQIQDTLGKSEIDEKLVAKATGATTVLKKAQRGRHGGEGNEMNIFDLLEMFRGGDHGAGRHQRASDPIQQFLLAAA